MVPKVKLNALVAQQTTFQHQLLYILLQFKMEAEDESRIEKFLEDYKRMKPTRFTYTNIKRITNGFSESLGEGAHGVVFKGMLS
ncbi:hypothetical protein Fmac_005113 [Flemingia macrophylla]|uniref:Uncharacterized protein n=1 Tax=Flemingia macrophylla TaxID=520843 RepID=A0ABD1N6U6_9FABA